MDRAHPLARCTAPLHPSQLCRVRVHDALVVLLSGCVLVDFIRQAWF